MNNVDGKKIIEYLNTLGLSTKDVLTLSDLKTNYRKLAKYFHPDNHDTGDAEHFKKVQEAYDYCQENLDYVNKQIKANFTINSSGFSSEEEEAFAMTALRAAASMRIFGFELNEQLTHKKLDENYYKLSILFQTILKDYKRLKVLNDAYAFLKENFNFVNILVACQFDYSLFKAAKAKADEMKREKEKKEEEARFAREKAERERKEREAIERRKAEEARQKAEQERKRREAEERARREQEKKDAQIFYKSCLEEEIEKIVLSAYSDKNRNTIRIIFDVYRKKESGIRTKNEATQTVSFFKSDIKKVKTIQQQKALKKRFTFAGIIAASMAVLVGISFGIKGIVDEVNRKNLFEDSLSLIQEGNYSKAKENFECLGDYKSSKNKAVVCEGLIMLEESISTKTEKDAINGIKKIISGGESVHVYYDSSTGHNVRRNRLSFDNAQYDEIISSLNFVLHKPNESSNIGYTFNHWYSGKLKYENMAMLCMDSTWSVNSYSISYHLDGGTNSSSNPKTYTIETDDIFLQNASKDNYTFSGWFDKQNGGNRITSIPKGTTGNIDLYARYEINHYTVNFYNWDYEKLYTTTVDHGGTVSYPYSIPTKPSDQQYSYSFSGWDKSLSNIVENTDFVAQFSNTINQYTVTFKNYDGTILGTDTVDYGTGASYDGDIPTKPISSDNRTSYVFSGWDITLDSIKSDCVAVAQYDEINRYLASFYNGENLLYSIMLDEGETPAFIGETPTKESTQQYSYEFSKWDPVPTSIHSDTNYQPVFTSTLNQYTVTFKNYDGTILGTSTVDYGTSASYSGETPTKPKTQQYSYTFSGWDLDLSIITEDVETTAQFIETINQYTVTFKNYNGSVLGTSIVDYGGTAVYLGSTPTKPKDQQYSYTFSGWNISLENVTSDRDAVALYDSSTNQYTVTFKNYDGTVLWTDTVDYGTSASYNGVTPTKPNGKGCSYTFSGWDKSFNQVLDDITVTASFEAELINGVFELSSDGKSYTLTSCTREEVILIPARHNGIPITKIGNGAFAFSGYPSGGPADPQRTLLKTIELSEGLKIIGERAFRFNESLETIVLPRSLTTIGCFAFGNTGFAADCIIRKNVTKMGERVFFERHNRVLCEAESKPGGWDNFWNENNNGDGGRNVVVWGYKD